MLGGGCCFGEEWVGWSFVYGVVGFELQLAGQLYTAAARLLRWMQGLIHAHLSYSNGNDMYVQVRLEKHNGGIYLYRIIGPRTCGTLRINNIQHSSPINLDAANTICDHMRV